MSIFTSLQSAFNGPLGVVAAFGWGIISILLSPCALVLVPMVIGFMSSQEKEGLGRTLALSLAFSSGVFVNLLIVSIPIVLGGAILTPFLKVINWISFVLLLIFGLALLDVLPLPMLSNGSLKARGEGIKGALLMGLFSGIITGPCALAFVAPILTLALNQAAAGHVLFSLSMVIAFALGYALVICLAGLFSHKVNALLDKAENGKAGFWMRQICGWLVIFAAAFFLYEA